MPIFYHVDRSQKLKQGQIINLTKYDDIEPGILQKHVDQMFPTGFSNHGEKHFLNNKSKIASVEGAIELIFEYVRRSNYPNLPSRFQSLYVFETIREADMFKTNFEPFSGNILEVESDKYFKGDMNLLALKGSVLEMSFIADRYWSGLPGSEYPFWEVLIMPPVKVLGRITNRQ